MNDTLLEQISKVATDIVVVDGVVYAPLEILASFGEIIISYAFVFGAAMWCMMQFLDLIELLIKVLFAWLKKHKNA